MKKTLLFFIFLILSSFQSQNTTHCECGTHEEGITYFTVERGDEYCSGEPGSMGSIVYYELSEGRTWRAVSIVQITGPEAQENCCPNPS